MDIVELSNINFKNVNKTCPSAAMAGELIALYQINPNAQLNFGQLEELYQENKHFMRESIRVMFSLAIAKVSIQIIDLPNERIGVEGAVYLRTLFPFFPRLSNLSLVDNALGTPGMRHLISAFRSATKIEILNLGMNHLNDESASVLAEGLDLLPDLQILSLRNNDIGDLGASSLASALIFLRKLTVLDLSFNEIEAEGCIALAQNFPVGLEHLSLIANRISPAATASLRLGLERLPLIQEVNLGGNLFKESDRRKLRSRLSDRVHFGVSKSLCALM